MGARVSESGATRIHLLADDESTSRLKNEDSWLDGCALLGRCPTADVQLHDRWASRRHCAIVPDGENVYLFDLGSKHGTFVNGQRVKWCELHSGDKLNIGMVSFVIERED